MQKTFRSSEAKKPSLRSQGKAHWKGRKVQELNGKGRCKGPTEKYYPGPQWYQKSDVISNIKANFHFIILFVRSQLLCISPLLCMSIFQDLSNANWKAVGHVSTQSYCIRPIKCFHTLLILLHLKRCEAALPFVVVVSSSGKLDTLLHSVSLHYQSLVWFS